MQINQQQIQQLTTLLETSPKKVILVAHTNPDGDAVGSLLAWHKALLKAGIESLMLVPNRIPDFLLWLPGAKDIKVFKNDKAGELAAQVAEADAIFCLDFNQISRLDALGEEIEKNLNAKKILIDHHLNPPEIYDIALSYPDSCSTCFLVFRIIESIWGSEIIDQDMAYALYTGIMTDTGNFSFSNLEPDLFRAVMVLVEKEIVIPHIHRMLFSQFSESRLRLLGYTLNRKLRFINPQRVAYFTLTEEELRRFNFQLGDSEGFVNYPLSIADVNFSAMFTEATGMIKISFRSQGDIDVNEFARRYFGGGGHKNASGARSFKSMNSTVYYFQQCVKEFFGDTL